MKDLKRQIEILAITQNGVNLSKADWAYKYGVSEITINRDLKELRNKGIEIYSKKGKVIVLEKPNQTELIELLSVYVPLTLHSELIAKKLKVLFKNKDEKLFSIITILSKAISEKRKVEIIYKRFSDDKIGKYLLSPINIDTLELNWIINAYKENEEILKSFYVQRIESIKLSDNKFKIPNPLNKNEKLNEIVLRFHPKVKQEIKDKIWFEDYELKVDEEGFTILKTYQPITNKLSAWCISWWDMIEIISPEELKTHTLEMIKYFKKTNK